ncbi:hypothetical protein [Effusibacillus lacus]|uniref:Uncharacterized protein n=1 Tax=Effusibacillus lacus TaxID=1348429 RepID=A0A292YEQ8_9BACL|nr:hypothetical protein [Effusibacillus lacus]TCS76360.1 hypothetical protein EDD64_103126 [Effusibacillus lacus]GAX91902.1 hypothetical protein EFBL_3593 [Effusibacillus lacus]
MYDDVHYANEDDTREDKDSMENDGGGVIPENAKNGVLVERQNLSVRGMPADPENYKSGE